MRDLAIVGTGATRFTKQPLEDGEALVREAVSAALRSSRLTASDVEAVFCGSVAQGPATAQRTLRRLGFAGVPMVNVENACASGSTALVEAIAWIRSGMCDVALALGVERLSHIGGPLDASNDGSGRWVFDAGLTLPGWYALKASARMAAGTLTPEQLAHVVVKSRSNAASNPNAHFRTPVTIDQVLASPVVADPLTLYQCCPKVDGAAAVVLVAGDRVPTDAQASWLRGLGFVSGMPVFNDAPDQQPATVRAAAAAYGAAGLEPSDVRLVELHDAFSIGEVLYTEQLGFCGDGEAGAFIAAGETALGGGGPLINLSGGLLSKGHPLGATGIGQVVELVTRMSDEAGHRRPPFVGAGLVHTMGASEFELDANACCVSIWSLDR